MADTQSILVHNLAPDPETDSVLSIARAIQRRKLTKPALLFLFSHRPLAFLTGQFLHTLQPLAELMDIRACGDIASILIEPDNLKLLEVALMMPDGQPTRNVL